MKKKILCITLAITMIIGIFSVGAIAIEGINGIDSTLSGEAPEVEPNYFYVENTEDEAGYVKWKTVSNSDLYLPSLQYSVDCDKWDDVTIGTAIDISANGKIYFRGTNPEGLSHAINEFIYVNCNVSHNVGGDITTLMNVYGGVQTLDNGYEFSYMFDNDAALTDASALILPATTLAESCYYNMFHSCNGLIKAPALPATTLAEWCYGNMFYGCISLETAPELPATELADYCYDSMFKGCSDLMEAPELPATELADYCYASMFSDCTSLKTAPELPATELADYCYSGMFYKCSSLKDAPAISAIKLAKGCCFEMFYNCICLETAPALLAAELAKDCYYEMFFNCQKLNSIAVGFTEFGEESETFTWLYNVSYSGTFYVPENFTTNYTKGTDTIPVGWTVKTAMSPVHKHIYDDVTYIWSEGLTTCTAYHTCTYTGCGHTEFETVNTITDEEKITATFTKDGFADQTKNLEDVTPRFYVSCYTEDGQCLTVGVPENDGDALNLTVPYDVYQDMKSAKLFTVNSSFAPLRPERKITK